MLFSIFFAGLAVATAIPKASRDEPSSCFCSGDLVRYNASLEDTYICGDDRLGPALLPGKLPLSTTLARYDRFNGLTPQQFLEKWTLKEGQWEGGYEYPAHAGFLLDAQGIPINRTVILPPGTLLDRFGYEGGKYFASVSTPYSQRALPPSSLNTPTDGTQRFANNYHVYRVVKDLAAVAGPIAPWFGQPGLGTQFYTEQHGVTDLLQMGFLVKVADEELTTKQEGCGFDRTQ